MLSPPDRLHPDLPVSLSNIQGTETFSQADQVCHPFEGAHLPPLSAANGDFVRPYACAYGCMVLYIVNALRHLFQRHVLKIIVHEHVHAHEQKSGLENDVCRKE